MENPPKSMAQRFPGIVVREFTEGPAEAFITVHRDTCAPDALINCGRAYTLVLVNHETRAGAVQCGDTTEELEPVAESFVQLGVQWVIHG